MVGLADFGPTTPSPPMRGKWKMASLTAGHTFGRKAKEARASPIP